MHNLEGIPFEDVVNDQSVSYATYRKMLKPDYIITWLHILSGFLALILLFFLSLYCEKKIPEWFWITIPCFSLLMGFLIAYLNLFIHEAGHFYIHPNKKINDLLANIVLCSWMGTHIKVYRKIHWHHHLYLAHPADKENSYVNPLSLSFIFETLTGIYLFRKIINKGNSEFLGKNLTKKATYMFVTGGMINLCILLFPLFKGYWQFPIAWIVATIILFPCIFTLRQIIEHRDEYAQNEINFYKTERARVSRLFSGRLFSSFFGAAGFNKHMIHHWDPYLPFTALSKVEKFLLTCERTKSIIISSQTTYFSVFKKLLYLR